MAWYNKKWQEWGQNRWHQGDNDARDRSSKKTNRKGDKLDVLYYDEDDDDDDDDDDFFITYICLTQQK